MKRINTILVCVSVAFCACVGADVTYTESTVPEDTSDITVRDGTASMVGIDAYRHLKHWWTFDNVSDLKAPTVGDLSLTKFLGGTLSATNDTKRGAGAVYFKSSTGYRVDPVPSFITPTVTEPFTISFWFKGGKDGNPSSRIFYYGPYGEPKGNAAAGKYVELMYTKNTGLESLRQFYWFAGAYRGKRDFTLTEENTPQDRWVHVAFCFTPNGTWQEDLSVSNATVSLYFDGVHRGTASDILNTGESPYLLFGSGYGPTSAGASTSTDTIFDEIMIFDKALSADEVAWVAENTRPYEFSAGWDISSSGLLDIAGICPQTVRGLGTVTNFEGLTLSPTASTHFGGTVQGASLTLDAASSVTQTLSSAIACTGTTTVASGTLKIDPARAIPQLENTLVAYYSCDDPDNPGRDDSGNGNNLGPAVADAYNSYVFEDGAVAGGAIRFPATGGEVHGYKSSGTLNGFTVGVDNSFVIAAWVRVDGHSYREGFFCFETSSGWRLNNDMTNHKATYYGDTSYMISYSFASSVLNGMWRHLALVYNASPDENESCYKVFVDGVLVGSGTKVNPATKHAAQAFRIGRGPTTISSGDNGYGFNGAIDEVFVLNGANTNDVAKLYNYRRAAFDAANAAAVLPENTTLTVETGATLVITNSIENVRELRGGGTVDIAAGSKLSVRKISRFTGRVVGGGSLSYPGMLVILR